MELSVLDNLPGSKIEINMFVDHVKNALEEGNSNPLGVLKAFKAIEKSFETLKPKITELALIEAKKYPGKSFELFGAEFSTKEAGIRWDYSNCNDPELTKLNKELELAQLAVKQRQEVLQTLDSPVHENVNEDTGEVYTIYPPVKKSSTVVMCSFI